MLRNMQSSYFVENDFFFKNSNTKEVLDQSIFFTGLDFDGKRFLTPRDRVVFGFILEN